MFKKNEIEDKTSKNEKDKEKSQKSQEEKTSIKMNKEQKSVFFQKKRYREKYEKLKKAMEDLEKLVVEKNEKNSNNENTINVNTDEWRQKVDFLLKNKDYSEEEFEFISSFAKAKGISIPQAAESKDVKDYLDFQRRKVAEENKIPEASFRSNKFISNDILSKEEQEKLDKGKVTQEEYQSIVQRIVSEVEK